MGLHATGGVGSVDVLWSHIGWPLHLDVVQESLQLLDVAVRVTSKADDPWVLDWDCIWLIHAVESLRAISLRLDAVVGEAVDCANLVWAVAG